MSEGVITDRLRQYALLVRLDRPIGSLLLLWPTLWALWLAAAGRPDPWVLLVFIVGTFLMRSAGCVINDYADRAIDPHVERTRHRPLAVGVVSATEALSLFAVLGFIAFALVLTLSGLAIALSLPAVMLAAIYPFMKRVTNLPQFVLGVAFSWGIPMAFAAQNGEVPAIAWLLMGANLCWVAAYDTMYAMVDRVDDRRIGVKSTAILFGRHDRLAIAALQALSLLGLAWVGVARDLNGYYFGGLGVAAALVIYQQVLIRERAAQACFKAFLNNAWFGAVVFLGLVLAHL